jgi:hypothetical protein
VSSALAFQVIPNVVIGADLWYLRHYEGLSLRAPGDRDRPFRLIATSRYD